MYLAHKVSPKKWDPHPDFSDDEVQADAITADLRTVENAMSFWECGDASIDEDRVTDVALAIAASADRFNRVALVLLTDAELRQENLRLKPTLGKSPVTDLNDRHVDVYGIDYVRLGLIAHRIAAAMKDPDKTKKFSQPKITKLLKSAYEDGRINPSSLKPSLLRQIDPETADKWSRDTGAPNRS